MSQSTKQADTTPSGTTTATSDPTWATDVDQDLVGNQAVLDELSLGKSAGDTEDATLASQSSGGQEEFWDLQFSQKLGDTALLAAPSDGDAARFSAEFEFPIASLPGVSLNPSMGVDVSNASGTFTIGGNLGLDLKGKVGSAQKNLFAELGLANISFRSTGDDATEAFELLRWRVWELLSTSGDYTAQTIANEAFDINHTLDTLGMLDAGDNVETAADLLTGFEFGGEGKFGSTDLGASFEYETSDGEVVGRDDQGNFYRHGFAEKSWAVKFRYEDFDVELSATKHWEEQVGEDWTYKAELELGSGGSSALLKGTLGKADWYIGLGNAIYDAVSTGLSDDATASEKIATLIDTSMVVCASDTADKLKKELDATKAWELEEGLRLTIEGNDGVSGRDVGVALESVEKIELDAGIADLSAERTDTLLALSADLPKDWTEYAENTRAGFAARLMARVGVEMPMGDVLTQGRPGEAMNRAEMTTIAQNILNLPDTTNPADVVLFDDVTSDDWFYEEAHTARAYGLVKGDEFANTFRGDAQLTVDDAKIVLYENVPEGASPAIKPLSSQVHGGDTDTQTTS